LGAKPNPVLVGTVLQAKSHGFMQQRRPFEPRYPIEPLSECTQAHLHAVARRSFPGFVESLNRSRTFSLVLDEELSPSEGTAYARTFSCRIITGGCFRTMRQGSSASNCLTTVQHLFPASQNISPWDCGLNLCTAEDLIQNGVDAYMRLEHAWGSIVPHFYGAHRVSRFLNSSLTLLTLFTVVHASGLFGILMEYVESSEGKLEEHSEVAQISFVRVNFFFA
jgi:hypothetical protein